MAEARRATLVLIPADLQKSRYGLGTLKVVFNTISSRWNKKIYIIRNRFNSGIYPSKPGNSLYVIGAVFVTSMLGYDLSFGTIMRIETLLQKYFNLPSPRDHLIATFAFSIGIWIILSVTRRKFLKRLFIYQGWMYEGIGRTSWKTSIWFALVKFLRSGADPKLYSYQKVLPTLPLPNMKDTIKRYLRSMKPLRTEKEFTELKDLAAQFQRKFGCRIQLFLYLKYLISPNYVSDWWEQFVYLSCRVPLIINSNYYGMDALFMTHHWLQSARAANLVCATADVMDMIRLETWSPILLQDVIPLCSAQYDRMFGTTRIPKLIINQKGSDKLNHNIEARHIVVIHKGRFFKCVMYFRDRKLEPVDIEEALKSILENTDLPENHEELLPILTAGERNHWAQARDTYFSKGVNEISLRCIETAAFILILEDAGGEFDPKSEKSLDEMAHALIHGKGYDRWFDKSFNIVVFNNGRAGFNAEHSWADAPIVGHMWEYILMEDVLSRNYGYTPDGHCRGIPASQLPKPERLKWEISQELLNDINVSMKLVKEIIDDLDIHIFVHSNYGKGFMKKCKVSPDAYIQIALQLTYYRMNGKFCQTYESSMTRLFRDGRTETVRSCSAEVCEAVRSIEDPKFPRSTKILYFNKAAEYHQQLYRDAMTGKGVDRHLFCMYVVCKFLNFKSEFLEKVLTEPWKLSTSQTPLGQTKRLNLSRYPNFVCAGGGFGPVADDGYGVSYIIAGEDRIFFHISSKFSCEQTNSKKFAKALLKSLSDIKEMFLNDK